MSNTACKGSLASEYTARLPDGTSLTKSNSFSSTPYCLALSLMDLLPTSKRIQQTNQRLSIRVRVGQHDREPPFNM